MYNSNRASKDKLSSVSLGVDMSEAGGKSIVTAQSYRDMLSQRRFDTAVLPKHMNNENVFK